MATKIKKIVFLSEKELFHGAVARKALTFGFKWLPKIGFNLRAAVIEKLVRIAIKKGQSKGLRFVCHFGNNFYLAKRDNPCDLVLVPKGVETSQSSVLRLTSRDFSSETFEIFKETDRPVDFLMVSNLSINKRQMEVFNQFSLSLNNKSWNGYGIFLCPTHKNETAKGFQLNFIEAYLRSSRLVREHLSLVRLSEELGFRGAQGPLLPLLMAQSRYLILASESEGEPRVLSEALSAGCKIVVRDKLKENIPPDVANYTLFSEFSELPGLIGRSGVGEKKKIPKYEENIRTFLNALGNLGVTELDALEVQKYIETEEGLDRILPNHDVRPMPWFLGAVNYPANEIKTLAQALKFYSVCRR
jgi:glycosyltransferase involved in cell wall biosynthesis